MRQRLSFELAAVGCAGTRLPVVCACALLQGDGFLVAGEREGSIAWSIAWLIGWLVGGPIGRSVGWSVGWLVSGPIGRSVGWSIGWLVDWLAGRWANRSVGRLGFLAHAFSPSCTRDNPLSVSEHRLILLPLCWLLFLFFVFCF